MSSLTDSFLSLRFTVGQAGNLADLGWSFSLDWRLAGCRLRSVEGARDPWKEKRPGTYSAAHASLPWELPLGSKLLISWGVWKWGRKFCLLSNISHSSLSICLRSPHLKTINLSYSKLLDIYKLKG